MTLESSKNQLNNEKNRQIRGKITKSYTTFCENKPNLSEDKLGASSYKKSKYEILPAWRSKKQTQSNPIQTQFAERPKMNANPFDKMIYKNFMPLAGQKTNPIQTQILSSIPAHLAFLSGDKAKVANLSPRDNQFIPKRSSLINNQLIRQTQVKTDGRRKRWNVFSCLSDFYYRTMIKSRAQIYDELLVIKCRQKNKDAFDELVGRWQKRLWHYAFKVTGSESAAWDIVQETWYGIIKGIRKLEDVDVFPQWVFRIANNKCTDWLRRQHRRQKLNNELTKQTQNESGHKQNGGEKTDSLRAAIERLSPDRRALLTLRYHEGFDISQIAEILNVPEGTVKSRLHRTVNELRQLSINGARLQ